MTNLTNLAIPYSYGDVLTTTNNGLGLDATLRPLQDGLGRATPITIATNAINFSRIGSTFQLDGVNLTATATDINGICNALHGISPSTGAFLVPCGTTAQRPVGVNGMFRFNTDTNNFEGYIGGWINIA